LSPRRNFTYVSDTVRGFLLAAHNGSAVGEVINIGSEPHISVGELVGRTLRILGVEKKVVPDEARIRPEKSEVRVLSCDSSKARAILGWAPRVALDDGLRQVVEQFRESTIDATRYAV
jgi:dTDP-glucose 4,6-dehydratase